ncbi:hypothetical protein VTI74DRAFT_9250 [Chaetomium olivicolor]
MGIPQLRRRLEHYAERATIEPCSVVVDGPALAYHVLGLCSKAMRRTSPFEQPSYELLGRTAGAWLTRIRECRLSISAIYFDSYLPSSKRPERIQRLIKSTRALIKYHSAYLAGVPKASLEHAFDAAVDLFPNTWPGQPKAQPPPPAFLVPAVIDALRDSSEFGHLVVLAPGEADGFCADHVRRNGGTVLTSDSDLLVHDLGEAGGVIFFTDIEAATEEHKLVAPQYRPWALCERLSLKPDTGLQYLAFEINRDPHLTLQKAIGRAKCSEAVSASRAEYAEFLAEYLSPEIASQSDISQLEVLALDPRVSELVLRSLQISEITTPSSQNGNDNELEMYLPFLLDCPSRTSAWEASKPVRQIAYAFLQPIRGKVIRSVSEMRRLQSVSSGLQVDVPPASEIDGLGTCLLTLLSKIETGMGKPELVWTVLSLYQDIVMAMERARGHPISLELLGQDARGSLDTGSWDFVHLVAQVQGTFYSLRMLLQILDYSAHHGKPLSTAVSRLQRYLLRLPPLAGFPSPKDFAETLQSVREAGGLACLKDLCAEYEDIFPQIDSLQKPQSTEKSKKRKATASAEHTPRPRSSNPFDLLAGNWE